MLVRRVANQAARGSNPTDKALEGKDVSRNASELDSASLRKMGVARLPEMLKPTLVVKQRAIAANRLPRGGWRQRASIDSQDIWETHPTTGDY